jgi:hypothetical protein
MGTGKRLPYRFAVIASLLLCVAIAVVWLRSYWWEDFATWLRPENSAIGVGTTYGGLVVSVAPPSTRWGIPYGREGVTRRTWPAEPHRPSELPDWWARAGPFIILEDAGGPKGAQRIRVTNNKWECLGFAFQTGSVGYPDGSSTVYARRFRCPLWFLSAATAILPATWLISKARNQRRQKGFCECGYDLRATPGRCPECGARQVPKSKVLSAPV